MTTQQAVARKPEAHELRRTRFGDEVNVLASWGAASSAPTESEQKRHFGIRGNGKSTARSGCGAITGDA
jgi:hypothetical protein